MQRHTATQEAAMLLAAGQPRAALRALAPGGEPSGFDADQCLIAGACAAALGDAAHAERLWIQALALDPRATQALFNLGLLHANAGRDDEAEIFYRRAIEAGPHNAAAWCNLGMLLAGLGRDGQAEQCLRRAAALAPGDAGALACLGALLDKGGRAQEAEPCLRQVLVLAPAHVGAHCNLGLLLARTGRHAESEESYRRAIALDGRCAAAHANLGLLLGALGRDAEAERHLRAAVALDPAATEVHSNLANLLAKLERLDEAEGLYRQAIALRPDAPAAYANLAAMLAQCGREAEAERYFRRALARAPGHALARLNLGYLLLAQGRLGEAWDFHESRCDPTLPNPGTVAPALKFARWQGQPLAGKSLLVWPEQGLGDEIQFCRYVPLLKAQGARHITWVCKAPLKPLLETLDGVDTILTGDAAQIPDHDYWTFPLSLPRHAATTLATIPAQPPYLSARPERALHWAQRMPGQALPGHELRVGLVWRGNPDNPNDADRSLPDLAVLAPLWSVTGVRFISLQKGPGEDQARNPPPAQPLTHLGSEIADFGDSAAIVHGLDLLITVDSAIAHVAGALAKPCWVLLPAHKTDWRWLQERSDSPWYPRHMRLFRQRRRGRWDEVVQQILAALIALTQLRAAAADAGS
jgi:Flp pilus assembly protein TadD